MELAELRLRLDVTEDEVTDAKLQLFLDDGVDWVQRVCNQDFLNDEGVLTLPSVAKKVIAKLSNNELNETDGVKKEEIGDVKFEYFAPEELKNRLLDELKVANLIEKPQLKFIPSTPRFDSGVPY